jgi:hypothetical protein
MLKTSIFDAAAGDGEPRLPAKLNKAIHDNVAAYRMDLDEGCKVIMDVVDGMVANNFRLIGSPK